MAALQDDNASLFTGERREPVFYTHTHTHTDGFVTIGGKTN